MKATIANQFIFPRDNTTAAPMIAALNDLLTKPVTPRVGLRIRRTARVLQQQLDDVLAEHSRLLDQYRKEEDDQVTIAPEFEPAWRELMADTFEVETIAASDLAGLTEITTLTLLQLGDLLHDDLEEDGNTTKSAAKRQARRK